MMDRRAFDKGLAWTVIVNLINKAIFPLAGIVISRLLGPGPLGAYAVLGTILMVSEILRDAGLTQTYLADREMDERKEGSYVGLAIITAVLPAVILVSASAWLAKTFGIEELKTGIYVMFFALVCNGIATIPRAKILKEAKMRELALIDLISGGTGLILTIILVLLGFAFWALVIQMLYCSVVTMLLSFRIAPVRKIVFEAKSLLETFRRTASLLAANALSSLFLLSDVFVIRKLLGSDSLIGIYGQGKGLASKPADFVTFPLTRMLIVAFSQAAGEKERLCRAFARAVTATMLFVTPIYLLMIFMAEPIIGILLGPKFSGSAPILAIMSVFLALRTIGTIAGTALVSDGKAKITMLAQFAGIAVTVALLAINIQHLQPVSYANIESYRAQRASEINATGSRLAQKATTSTGEAQWVVFAFPDKSRAVELFDNQTSRVVDRGKDTTAYQGPKSLQEIAGTKNIHYQQPPGMGRLKLIAWFFTMGAAVLYGLAVVLAFFYFPAPAVERAKLLKACTLTIVVGAMIFGFGQLPLPGPAQLGLVLLLVPLLHLAAIGLAFAASPLAYLSPAGVKRLWDSL